jgi:hypothetical protein
MPKFCRNADSVLIEALAAGKTPAEAARLADVSPRTVYRRMKEQEFQECVSNLKWLGLEQSVSHVTQAGREACDRLIDLLHAKSERVQLNAAKAILTQMVNLKHDYEAAYRDRDLRGAQPLWDDEGSDTPHSDEDDTPCQKSPAQVTQPATAPRRKSPDRPGQQATAAKQASPQPAATFSENSDNPCQSPSAAQQTRTAETQQGTTDEELRRIISGLSQLGLGTMEELTGIFPQKCDTPCQKNPDQGLSEWPNLPVGNGFPREGGLAHKRGVDR